MHQAIGENPTFILAKQLSLSVAGRKKTVPIYLHCLIQMEHLNHRKKQHWANALCLVARLQWNVAPRNRVGISQIRVSSVRKSSLPGRPCTLEGQFHISTEEMGRYDSIHTLLLCYHSPWDTKPAFAALTCTSAPCAGAEAHSSPAALHLPPGQLLALSCTVTKAVIKSSVQRHRYENVGSGKSQNDESTSPRSGNVPSQQWESSWLCS